MYANGMVPLSVLVHVVGNIWLPPGTAARFAWAFEIAFQKYGVRLRFTPDRDGLGGWNGYRPKFAQVLYKKHYGRLAAAVGFSTHGGNVNGREIFAADIDNWGELGWARFAAVMRLAGLTVDYVTPREEWHVVDLNDPWAVPTVGAVTINAHTTNRSSVTAQEEDEMNVFMMTTEAIAGAGERGGLRRWLVNPWEKERREISSEEEAMYKAVGVKSQAGLQPLAYAEIFRVVSA